MKIKRERFWKIVNAQRDSVDIKRVLASVTLGDVIDDPQGIAVDMLSEETKNFVEYMRKANNTGRSKLYRQILMDSNKESTRYNLMLQASLYSEKLESAQADRFAQELEWKNATRDDTYAWIRSVFAQLSRKAKDKKV